MSNPSAIFDWAKGKEAELLFRIFAEAGRELRFVGGCVRDRLMNLTVTDLDAATVARPEEMISILDTNKIRNLPTGLAHGTVTAVFENRTIEITTLRLDTACDGRHAEVEYTDDWEADAARRDFTVNAFYLDAAGTIHDYFTGLKDLAEKKIRFIGDAAQRIEEDYLRVLRFFRFLATHGNPPADAQALAACKDAKEKLSGLSGERIQKEMMKLLAAGNPAYALGVMQETGVLDAVLGYKASLGPLPLLLNLEKESGIAPNALLRLSLLGEMDSDALSARWKLSNADAKILFLLVSHPELFSHAPYLPIKRAIRTHGKKMAAQLLLRDAVKKSLAFAAIKEPLEMIEHWDVPCFPVSGEDLIARGWKPGKELGDLLKQLEARWEESDYTLTKEELL